MPTTLDIDDRLAAKELARRDGAAAEPADSPRSARSRTGSAPAETQAWLKPIGGFIPFPANPGVETTNEMVNALRDAEGL